MKILCLPYTFALSHISRPLAIATELRARGHQVIFAGHSHLSQFITNEGFEVHPLYQLDPKLLFVRIQKGQPRFVTERELRAMIEADLALFAQEKPDLVLTDGRFSARISTAIAQVSHAAIVNVSSTEYRALPYIPFFENIPKWLLPKETFMWKLLELLNLKLEMYLFDNTAKTFKGLSKEYRLPVATTATNCLTGNDLTILPDLEAYFPARKLPNNYHYVGPLTWQNRLTPPNWWPPKKNGGHIIYVTLGTTWMGAPLSNFLKEIPRTDFKVIVTTGRQASSIDQELSGQENQIYLENFLDGDLVMPACDVVVCHGGNGTIYQALRHGKPVIGIPTIPDQAFNMRRVEALKVGITLPHKLFENNPVTLLDTINKVLTHAEFYKHAAAFAKIIKQTTPAQTAADLIEKLS